jgi:uncharacterized integral membrane protein (TIGR00697 family)
MFNELIFLSYTFVIMSAILGAVWLSYEALVAFVCLQMVLMNIFVTKEIVLCGFVATAADVLGIGMVLSLNLIQEFYGAERAKQSMWLGFYAAILSVILSLLHLSYLPSSCDMMQPHFVALFSPMPRIIIASLISFLISQTADRHLYAYLQRSLEGRYFIARNTLSGLATQLLDTVLFSFLGLYGMVSSISNIIIVSYGIKIITMFIIVPFLGLSKKLVKPNV